MKGRKNSMTKKLMALCLMVIFVFSMSLSAFAAPIDENSTGTVTVTGLESDNGATITAFKIIDINFDTENQQLKEPVYTWHDSVAAWVAENYPNYTADGTVTKEYMDATGSELKAFYDAMSTANLSLDVAATTTMEGQIATLNLPMGQYVIIADKAENVYSVITANVYPVFHDEEGWSVDPVTVALKGSAPGIEKTVDPDGEGENDKTVAIGDKVSYVITADIPVYPEDAEGKTFKIGDTLSDGLTLDKTSIQVMAGDKVLTAGTEYTVEFNLTDPDRTFEIDFKYDVLKATAENAAKVTVKYTVVVNENAFTVDELGNSAFVGYQRDPYDENSYQPGETVKEDVYTYGIDLTKVDKANAELLAGAEFELRKDAADSEALALVKVEDGIYRPMMEGEEAETVTTLIVSAKGELKIQGIDVGTYYLKETKAPGGYVLPNKDVVIVLVDDNLDGKLDEKTSVTIEESDVASVQGVTAAEKTIQFKLTNTSSEDEGFVLPTTGGAGTLVFSVIGIVLMGAAVVMVVVAGKRKLNH